MKASTVKLDGPVLKEIHAILSEGQTLTGYVREVISADLRQRKMRNSALLYQKFLQENPEELKEINTWEKADLSTPPKSRPAKN